MTTALVIVSGLCWTATYLLAIRIGFRDRTFAIPVVALAANFSWEFQFSFVRPSGGAQGVINIVWFLFDCALLYTAVRFGPREFRYLRREVYYACLAGLLVLGYLGMNLLSTELDAGGGTLSAFLDNTAMSGLFLAMLAARGGSRGQSVGIAATKLVGTAAASLSVYLEHNPAQRAHAGLLLFCYLTCLVLDLAYLLVLRAVIRHERASGGGAMPPASASASGRGAGGMPGESVAA